MGTRAAWRSGWGFLLDHSEGKKQRLPNHGFIGFRTDWSDFVVDYFVTAEATPVIADIKKGLPSGKPFLINQPTTKSDQSVRNPINP